MISARMAFLAISIAVRDPLELELSIQRAAEAVRAGAQLVEWRIDSLAHDADAARHLARLLQQSPAPCIVTCRPAWEGGEYAGEEALRAGLLESAINSDDRPRYVDVELAAIQNDPGTWRGILDAIQRSQSSPSLQTSLILSSHDFRQRPADLLQRVERMIADERCAAMKVAWMARSLRDNLEAFDLLRERRKPAIVLCMGPFGLMSRALAGKFGGLLTFAADREGDVTGPGQPTLAELRSLFRFDQVGHRTRVYGVIGWPVEHSMSPAIHNAAFGAVGFDGVYLPLPIPPEYEHFKATVGALVDHQGLDFRGASVTIPHKENLLRFIRERGGRSDPLAEFIGAANALVVGSAGGLECVNTDCRAAVESLGAGMSVNPSQLAGKRIAVLGAGGAARAVVAGLLHASANVVIFNRTRERAESLVDEMRVRAAEAGTLRLDPNGRALAVGSMDELRAGGFDIYINCTPVGMEGAPGGASNESPLPPNVPLNEQTTVFDTVYVPPRTPLIKEAESRGARTITGVDMFLRQAALQFEMWTGKPAPIDVFRKAIHAGRRT